VTVLARHFVTGDVAVAAGREYGLGLLSPKGTLGADESSPRYQCCHTGTQHSGRSTRIPGLVREHQDLF